MKTARAIHRASVQEAHASPTAAATDGGIVSLRFSLIIATFSRTRPLDECLASLVAQTYAPYEVIVVDQNPDDRVRHIVEQYAGVLPVRRLHSLRGASRARNAGIDVADGDVIGFPDDDCVYPNWLLSALDAEFRTRRDVDGFAIRPRNAHGQPFPRFDQVIGPVSRENVFNRISMIGIFLRRQVVEAVGGFDEALGPGAGTRWGAGEDIDYPLRAVGAGFRLEYRPDLSVVHSFDKPADPRVSAALGRSYGAGLGWLIRRHRYPASTAVHRLVLRPLAGLVLGAVRGSWNEVRYYAAALRGRISGWLHA